MFVIVPRASPTVAAHAQTQAKTSAQKRSHGVRAACARDDARVPVVVDRRTMLANALSAFAVVSTTMTPLGAAFAGDDDASFTSKLSAKEQKKAEILAAARAKAQAQAATPVVKEAPAPTNAAMFMTEDPGRGGGPDAPNVAAPKAEEAASTE
mmetsp:Transcript_1527/g.5538  ORF Transcript_1527/g.5538 Transcript_1527/m.5538 type:complete len:153 (-) Transcript_1527:797-1255(-)